MKLPVLTPCTVCHGWHSHRCDKPAVDRDRALAALIRCAEKHPGQRLGELIGSAVFHGLVEMYSCTDDQLAAAFHAYAEAPR